MPIFIYNSLSRKKEEFIPINPPKVNIYTCGVTVYDDSHIGHARSLYIFDVIRRYLKYKNYNVKFVRNITDVDDKIINRANELKVDLGELVNKYILRYQQDLEALGIEKGDYEPRATENIPDMIKYIQALIVKGYAYEVSGDVYFNVRKFSDYGKLSGQSIDQMDAGFRICLSDIKHDHLDFALWKKSKELEPSWDSPWGQGRPGWHIECSVMSQKFLKTDTLDIHAGGRDLIFPHHENEIAQAEALTGKTFAKYWMHHGLLTINGQKMSKSLGNFITIKDFLSKYKDANILKLFFLSAHYSHPVDYNDRKIEETRQALDRIINFIRKAQSTSYSEVSISNEIKEINGIKIEFDKAMDDDFNAPGALSCIFELVNLAYKNIDSAVFVKSAGYILRELSSILGLSFKKIEPTDLDSEIESKILARNQARKQGNFALADKIRKELEEKEIIIEDEKDKTIWRRKL